jgi:uncharacterized membrane protein
VSPVAKALKDTAGAVGKTAGGTARTAGKTATGATGAATKATGALTGPLTGQMHDLVGAALDLGVASIAGKVGSAADRLTEYAEQGGGPGGLLGAVTGAEGAHPVRSLVKGAAKSGFGSLKDKIKGAFGGGKSGSAKKAKVTNIVESIDVGVPVRLAYDQWTRFTEFPGFTKKVESVEQEADEKLRWRAKIFWSKREWEATILDQAPDERIVWRSKGPKGWVDGAVTFHELAPNLTRIVVVLEYHPKGLFEHTGNLWRAQGRRARLELKHFRRHVMTRSLLHPDEVEGWRGEIHDGEVVKDHETALREERENTEPADEDERESKAGSKTRRSPGRQPGRGSGRSTTGTRSRSRSQTRSRSAKDDASAEEE